MAHVSKDTLRFMVGQVDWTTIMHELVDTQPETVVNLMNDHFKSQPDPEPECDVSWQTIEEAASLPPSWRRWAQLVSLDSAFTYVARAVNTKDAQGRQTTLDKIRAIKELRKSFDLTHSRANLAVEKMMDNYEKDPLYYPRVTSKGSSGYEFD